MKCNRIFVKGRKGDKGGKGSQPKGKSQKCTAEFDRA